jgi:hypothetical protein
MNARFTTLVAIIILAALSRFLPHPFNFTPIAAIALFGGAYFKNQWQAIAVPMGAMFLSDIVYEIQTGFGFHSGTIMVYSAFALVAIMGMVFLKKVSLLKVVSTALASSLVFFLITNCAFFYPTPEVIDQSMISYPHTYAGLIASYTAGIPFLRNQILGDLFFSGVLFGGFALLQRRFDVLKMA